MFERRRWQGKWHDPMLKLLEHQGVVAVLFTVVVVVVGTYLILNLFIAVLLQVGTPRTLRSFEPVAYDSRLGPLPPAITPGNTRPARA